MSPEWSTKSTEKGLTEFFEASVLAFGSKNIFAVGVYVDTIMVWFISHDIWYKI